MVFKLPLAGGAEIMSDIATTAQGRVRGERRGAHLAFRGLPFAKPPVFALRFAAPEPPEPWADVRPAIEFGPSAPQGLPAAPGMLAEGPQSEDCLYLNVYTPALDGARRPVMFWIHGGAFVVGSGSQPLYDGGRMAERGDVVVVTINYRLGALGYLYLGQHGDWGAPNAAQLDQVAALRWVRDNIAEFGGDPNNVTIFGESAGSMAVCTLLAMPAARGLFHRAIAQSGASLRLLRPDNAARITEALLKELGIPAPSSQRLRDVPLERILQAQLAAGRDPLTMRGFSPVCDGVTVPRQPDELFASGEGADVPLLIGTNRDEMNLFNAPLLRDVDKPLDDASAIAVLQGSLPRRARERAPSLLSTYEQSRAARNLPHGNRALLGAIQGDMRFRIPAIRFAEAYRARNERVFMYLFTYASPAMRGALGACHGLEIPFVFGTIDKPLQDRFAGKGPVVQALSEQMMDAWISFARNDAPGHPRLGDWPPYEPERRATMVVDKQSGLQFAPFDEEREVWDGAL
jgi:para-nitrobenzyl esterase